MTAQVSSSAEPSKAMLWTGRILSLIPTLMLLFSASMKLMHGPQVVEGFTKFGYAEKVITPLGVVEVLCALIYAIPQTSVLGAILCTGYLGGAIATHVRAGEGFAPALILGVIVWAGLFLRDRRLQALLPLRRMA